MPTTFTQKLLLITTPLLAVYVTYRIANDAGFSRGRSSPASTRQDNGATDSPIIIGDGSIHVRQSQNLIHEIDGNHAFIHLDKHVAWQLTEGSCDNTNDNVATTDSSHCTSDKPAIQLQAPFQIVFKDASGKERGVVGTLHPDGRFPGLILFSSRDRADTIVGREPDNGGDGEGFVMCAKGASKCQGVQVNNATLAVNGKTGTTGDLCKNASKAHCYIKISYCTGSSDASGVLTHDGSCK